MLNRVTKNSRILMILMGSQNANDLGLLCVTIHRGWVNMKLANVTGLKEKIHWDYNFLDWLKIMSGAKYFFSFQFDFRVEGGLNWHRGLMGTPTLFHRERLQYYTFTPLGVMKHLATPTVLFQSIFIVKLCGLCWPFGSACFTLQNVHICYTIVQCLRSLSCLRTMHKLK